MTDEIEKYRNSIWQIDRRFDLALLRSLTDDEIAGVSRMLSVNAAKVRVPPAGLQSHLQIYQAASAMPERSLDCTADMLERFLALVTTGHKGIGITTAICMLAVEKRPTYPMYDEFGANGLLAHGDISSDEFASLKSKNLKLFSKVYVERLIPLWLRDSQERTEEETDLLWRNYAKRGRG